MDAKDESLAHEICISKESILETIWNLKLKSNFLKFPYNFPECYVGNKDDSHMKQVEYKAFLDA